MDQLPPDFKPTKKRNIKAIILVVAVIAIIGFAAFNSYQTKYVDDPADLHALLQGDMSLKGGRARATILNDGIVGWDVDSVNVVGAGKVSCWRMAKNVMPNETATISCSVNDIDKGATYSIIIYVKNSNNEESKFLITGSAEFRD